MYPTLFYIGSMQITTYGLMIALAFATLWLCTVNRGQKLGYSPEFVQNLLTIIVICAMVFARVLYVATNWDYFAAHPSEMIFKRDGYVFLGGFVGAVAFAVWYTRRNNHSVLGVADLFAPYLALAQSIGRIGCLLFGCCYGSRCDLPWAVQFPKDSPAYIDHIHQGLISGNAAYSMPVHPSQLYHVIANFTLFIILINLRRVQSFRGQLAMSYLILYSFGRFLIEYTRGDYRGGFGWFSTSQWISVILIIGGVQGYRWLRRLSYVPDSPVKPEVPESEADTIKSDSHG